MPYVPDGMASLTRIEGEPFEAWVELPDVRRNALTPYGARSVRDLRARESSLGDILSPDHLVAHDGVPRWPGRASIYSSKPTYGWPLGDETRPDPITGDFLFWGKALVAALATLSGLYVLSRL